MPLLNSAGVDAVAVELPAADDSADLFTYADIVRAAVADVTEPVVLVAQSMGAFTAPIVAGQVPTARIVLVNPMVPRAGESAGQWWAATGQKQAMLDNFRRIGLGDKEFDPIEDFFHDVPADVREEAFREPEPPQSDTPFEQPWPLDALAGRSDLGVARPRRQALPARLPASRRARATRARRRRHGRRAPEFVEPTRGTDPPVARLTGDSCTFSRAGRASTRKSRSA